MLPAGSQTGRLPQAEMGQRGSTPAINGQLIAPEMRIDRSFRHKIINDGPATPGLLFIRDTLFGGAFLLAECAA
jgi:hypothetical protein